MTPRRAIVSAFVLLLAAHIGLSALSFFGRKSLCLFPPHFVTDEERIEQALTTFHELSVQKFEPQSVDRKSCCSVVRSRSAPEFAVYFRTVLLGKWEEIVKIKYGPEQDRSAYFRSGRCGKVIVERD